jgi:hypothetical protein
MNRPPLIRGWIFLLALAGTGLVSADPAFDIDSGPLRYDWLQPVDQQRAETVNGTFSTTSGQNLSDPFAVVSSGTLWQDSESVTYSRPIMDSLALNCSSSATTQDGSPDALGNDLRAETVFKPLDTVIVKGNVHDTSSDQSVTPVVTSGAGASLETHLPLDTVFTAAVNSDRTACDTNPGFDVATNAYDAQVQKPLGKLPVSLVLKSHYIETATPGAGATRLPSFEQSLLWKPAASTTLQAGLRQQQYQNFPGIDNELNEALFADWTQKIIDDKFTWHSYAEMVNSRSTVEIAAAGAGVNGTPQPNTPNGGTSLGSTLPVSTSDETLTFSTGPSIKLQQDLSASLEYSSSWDQNPVPGAVSGEQRVSLSLKGTF